MTSWVDLASIVAPYAPTIGKMLGGLTPIPGGALMGEWAGGLLAKQLGVPATPEAVEQAVVNIPPQERAFALNPVENEANAEWEARARIAEAEAADRTAQSASINASIQHETTAKVPPWHWRHLLGYVIGLWYVVPLPGLAYLFFTGDASMIGQVTALLGSMSAFVLGGSALLGAVAYDTSRFKEVIATGAPREAALPAVKKALRRS